MDSSAAGGYASIIGAVVNAFGAYQSAQAQKQNLKIQANIDKINARISEMGAWSALDQGQWQAGQISRQAGQLMSSQRVAQAANGLDLGVGSAAEMRAGTDMLKEIDMNMAMSNALRSAWGYRMQGMNYTARSQMARAQASGINPGMSAAGSLLSNAGQIASGWYALKNAYAPKTQDPAPVEERSLNPYGDDSGDSIRALGYMSGWWK